MSTQPECVEDVNDGHTENRVQEEPKSNDKCDVTGTDITTTSDGVDEGRVNLNLENTECAINLCVESLLSSDVPSDAEVVTAADTTICPP